MRVLTYTTLYPNNIRQRHGIFVENRIKSLSSEVGVVVVAPVPYVPPIIGKRWSKFISVKTSDMRYGISVLHPRYLVIPKIGMSLAPFLMAFFTFGVLKRLASSNDTDFDVIDAHYVYPDGVAAAILGKIMNKPVVITARGTDINVIPNYLIPRFLIKWAFRQAEHVVSVSEALSRRIGELGVESDRLSVIRNGVDTTVFYPDGEPEGIKSELGIKGDLIISVGNLVPLKGHDLVLEAVANIPNISLIIVGEGSEYKYLKSRIDALSIENRVRIIGSVQQHQLRRIYTAADLLVLASSREGLPNVLLESMACGTRVLCTPVGGAPEVVNTIEAGVIVNRDSTHIEKSIRTELNSEISKTLTVEHAKKYDSGVGINKCMQILKNIHKKL